MVLSRCFAISRAVDKSPQTALKPREKTQLENNKRGGITNGWRLFFFLCAERVKNRICACRFLCRVTGGSSRVTGPSCGYRTWWGAFTAPSMDSKQVGPASVLCGSCPSHGRIGRRVLLKYNPRPVAPASVHGYQSPAVTDVFCCYTQAGDLNYTHFIYCAPPPAALHRYDANGCTPALLHGATIYTIAIRPGIQSEIYTVIICPHTRERLVDILPFRIWCGSCTVMG